MSEYIALSNNIRNVVECEAEILLKKSMESIKRLYKYFNPNYYYDDLNIRIDGSNRTNNRLIFEVFNEQTHKSNPSFIFSQAQNNVLAVSIFLSFALQQKWSNLDFICMDDPIQNMDDINIHNFTDIIRGASVS